MPRWRRPFHRTLAGVFASMDAAFLLEARCFFGGGTLVALMLDEFRESRDVDFLCSDREGFRRLRETVSERSLGRVMRAPLPLGREVRADRDGIRTFLAVDGTLVKLEIVLEGRIDLGGGPDKGLGLPVLGLDHLVAEKVLANADCGLDESTCSRDLFDLAFLAAHRGREAMVPGLRLAQAAYGSVAERELALVLAKVEGDRKYAAGCVTALGIEDRRTLRQGLAELRVLARRR